MPKDSGAKAAGKVGQDGHVGQAALLDAIHHPYMEGDSLLTDGVRIGEIGLQPGAGFSFVFDFGDLWTFRIQLELIEETDPELQKPKVMEAHGEPPAQYPTWDDDAEWVFDDDS